MRRQDDEIIPGDKRVAKTWLLYICLYLLFLLWLEPLIDFLLSMETSRTQALNAIEAFNQKKVYVSSIAFGVARSLPIMVFLWLGFQVMKTQRLPPPGLKLPFSVRVVTKQGARMAGMLMMTISILLLLREISMMVNAQPA